MTFFDRIRSWLNLKPAVDPYTAFRAELTDDLFTVTEPNGTVHKMLRSEIQKIAIKTTDSGPFTEDVFWAVSDSDHVLFVPQASPDFDKLMTAFNQFPGFDYGPFMKAMACAENNEFICWTSNKKGT